MHLLLPALLAILPTTTLAFYPYHRSGDDHTSQNSPRAVSRPRSAASEGSLHVPIWKAPAKRQNRFPIVRAAIPKEENAVGVHQDGTDHSYFCSFKVGTSDKEFHLLLDSAASNTWLMSAQCTTNACGVHTTLGARDSSTLKSQSGTFSVTYGTGSVEGVEASDTVHLGSMSVPLTFGMAQEVSDEFSSFPMDGIVGLGRQENIADKTGMIHAPPLMDVLMTEKVIESKLYALDLWRASDGGTNTGALHFGRPDTTRYTGELNQIPAVKNNLGFWEIPVGDAGVNGNIAGLPGRTAIIDSGTSYILMPRDDAVQLHELITGYRFDGVESFTVPCGTTAKIQFTFGGVTYDIQPADYIGASVGFFSGQCSTNIIGRQTFGPRQWLVGDVFLKNVYTVFDFEKAQVGFGVKREVGTGNGVGPTPTGESIDVGTNDPLSTIETPLPAPTTTYATVTTTAVTSITSTQTSTILSTKPAEDVMTPAEPIASVTEHAQQSTEPQPQAPAEESPTSPPSAASDTAQSISQMSTLATTPQDAESMSSSTFLTTNSASGSARPPTATGPTLLPPGAATSGNSTQPASSGTESGAAASSSSTAESVNGASGRDLSWACKGLFIMWLGMMVFA